ncbi:cAMP-dependent protein kinase catalytic subunit 1-like [Symsagittifera roscoffensis]|uniref:cAMP-dependent protein kinase catalytic subunit 1-like n=1 Tax=Symsagittifera roscoffensis TaxID=84072 RepID=UPI00307CA76E
MILAGHANFQTPETPGVIQYLTKAREEFDDRWSKNPKSDVTLDDFDIKRTLGSGSFGRVVLAQYKHSKKDKFVAIKILDKDQIMKQKQVSHTVGEKKILSCCQFPFLVKQYFAFKDNSYLYIALEFVSGGELFTHLRNAKRFGESRTRFYGSQVVLAFEYLHFMNLIHRDLKPENLLIDHRGYVKLTDFGFCKRLDGRAWTLCGTPQYLAPEIILSKGYSKAVDWWTFGVLMFEMAAGYCPFHAKKHIKLYEKIVAGEVEFPEHFSPQLKDIVRCLLQVDVTRRYGALRNGTQDVKNHKFFASVDYIATYQRKMEPPFVPDSGGDEGDANNFDEQKEKSLDIASKCKYEEEFIDF